MNELQVNAELQLGLITFNFEELKEKITGITEAYKEATFCDESIPNAKAEIASLRKIKAAIDTRRKDIKKECMKPYDDFEVKVKEIMNIIDKPILDISAQIEDFEQRRVVEKKEKILELYQKCIGENEYIKYASMYNDKWENKTYKLSDIEKEMSDFKDSVMNSVDAIRNLNSESIPKALELFKQNFSLTNAIAYVNNYEQQKREIMERENEKRAKEEEQRRIADMERAKQEERKKIAEEQRTKEETDRMVQEEVAKAKEEVIDSLTPDAEEKTQTYIYKVNIGTNGKQAFEMYMDSVGMEWELM